MGKSLVVLLGVGVVMFGSVIALPAFAATHVINWNGTGGIFPILAGNMLDPSLSAAGQQTADNNQNGTPDSTEAELLGHILAHDSSNGGKPWHDAVYNAYEANRAKLAAEPAIISANTLTSNAATDFCCLYVTMGDDQSWEVFVAIAGGIADFLDIPFDPVRTDYVGVPGTLAACGDPDIDGVNNASEFFGQSMNRANYVLAAQDAATAICGSGPGACAGDADCFVHLIPNIDFKIDATNHKVYYVTPSAMTWADAEAYAQALTLGGVPKPSHLASINSSTENTLCKNLAVANGSDLYIGGSDADAYLGEDMWVWVDNPLVEFWHGKGATGYAVGGAYKNWTTNEPNGTGEDCAELKTDGKWNDVDGTSLQKGIIEINGDYPDTTPADGIPDAFVAFLCGPGCGPKAPTADFTWSASPEPSPFTKLPVQFTDASLDNGADITAWAWNFGDPTSGSNTSNLPNPTHTYLTAGTYTVSLTVTNEVDSDTSEQDVVVALNPYVFSFTKTPGGDWLEVGEQIDLSVSIRNQEGTVTYQWFKDGSPITLNGQASTYTIHAEEPGEAYYFCRATDTTKAVTVIETEPVWVTVFALGTLPVCGVIGLIALLGAVVAGGRTLIRKK